MSEDRRIKVINPNKFNVGVKFDESFGRPREVNMRATVDSKKPTFALFSLDEVYYIDSQSALFKRRMLDIEDIEENQKIREDVGLAEASPNHVTDEEINEMLSGNPLKMKKWLKSITEPHVIERIYIIACDMDLAKSKVKDIEEKAGKELVEKTDKEE